MQLCKNKTVQAQTYRVLWSIQTRVFLSINVAKVNEVGIL